MNITVNGAPATLDEAASVADAVAAVLPEPGGRGVAVALNGEVVPRASWPRTPLSAGDRVEVLTAAQGG